MNNRYKSILEESILSNTSGETKKAWSERESTRRTATDVILDMKKNKKTAGTNKVGWRTVDDKKVFFVPGKGIKQGSEAFQCSMAFNRKTSNNPKKPRCRKKTIDKN